jgi:hypothetical protein
MIAGTQAFALGAAESATSPKGIPLAGRTLVLTVLKGKGSKKGKVTPEVIAEAKKRLAIANAQPTLGLAFLECGIQTYDTDNASWLACYSVLRDLSEQNFLDNDLALTLEYGLFGYPDETFIPDGLGSAALLTLANPPLGILVGGVSYKLDSIRPTIQKNTETSWSTVDALNALSNLDPGAADLVADMILKAQAQYPKKYLTPLTESFTNAVWRGAKKALQGVADVAAFIIPTWMQVLIGLGAVVYIGNSFKR